MKVTIPNIGLQIICPAVSYWPRMSHPNGRYEAVLRLHNRNKQKWRF
jgi:hypothetical protein